MYLHNNVNILVVIRITYNVPFLVMEHVVCTLCKLRKTNSCTSNIIHVCSVIYY